MTRNTIVAASIACVALSSNAFALQYNETFPSGAEQVEQLRTVGWCGGNAGDPICLNRPSDPGNRNFDSNEGAVSVGVGQDGTNGFAFFSQPATHADGFLFTQEFVFNTSDFISLSWYQRDNTSADETRLAFEIGGNWFVESTGRKSSSSTAWEKFTVNDLSTLSFVNYGVGGNGGTLLPSGDAAGGFAAGLPTGIVTSWGFAWDDRTGSTNRIDTIELHVVPLPAAAWLLLAVSGGLIAAKRRRSDRAA